MPLNPLSNETSTTSATQRVHHELRKLILVGKIPPGERLKVDRLKAMLDTGASPIREALSLLTSDQLVERIDQRGFRAANASREQFEEVLKLRCAFEDMALRDSIANATPAWEEELVLAHHHMARAPRDEVEPFETLHKKFHLALLQSCGSPILLKFCAQLYDLNIRYRYLAGQAVSYGKRDVAQEHADILQAALDRDPERASDALMQHYRKTGKFLAGQIAPAAITPA